MTLKSNVADLPELYRFASCYCKATTGSNDVERAFSAYYDILNDKWRSLDRSTIKAIHFSNWNLRFLFSKEQRKDRPISTTCSACSWYTSSTSYAKTSYPGADTKRHSECVYRTDATNPRMKNELVATLAMRERNRTSVTCVKRIFGFAYKLAKLF